ncbi:MAG: redox-sensing transcriptional repressor Rex [Candidatus Marinimicrobia bacterium]|nr:redox-sensing transcriptional repressor Rex [Candidatus Neomarinimicrobiota bacterium]
MNKISDKKIERIITYRRVLLRLDKQLGKTHVFSHQLASSSGASSAQVRRDLMEIGYTGSPAHGYEIRGLLDSIGEFIDPDQKEGIALVGVGNLGRAIIDYFNGQSSKLEIVTVFDVNPDKIERVISGCRSYHVKDLKPVIIEKKIKTAVITVPSGSAQSVADELIEAGVKGILNYAPITLTVPHGIYVENRDMITTLEKVSYFAKNNTNK